MSTLQLAAVRTIWRARRERTGGDTAYALYAAILAVVIVVVPIVYALWGIASSPTGVTVLTSPRAPSVVSLLAAALWGGALLAGRKRGPALLPSFLLHALTSSGLRRSVALRRPVIRSAALVVAALAGSAVFVGMVLLAHGQAQVWGLMAFIAAAIASGIVAALMWLAGQVFPRAAFPIARSLLVLAGMSLSMPQLLAFMPWGWVGATYPPSGSLILPLVGIAVLVAALIAMAPVLLNRLTGAQLSSQAAKWERATTFSFSFDIRGATAVYEAAPRTGRHIRAITPSRRRWVTFFVRDVVGQLRTPARSLGTILATAAAGVLLTLSLLPGVPTALLAGTAGAVIYAASGPLTKGLQHAANAAGDYPIYGISDRHLVLLHSLFPLAALLLVLPVAATATALASGVAIGIALTGACPIGVLALALRFGTALKGPLPPSLLTPMSTPAGDLSIVMQVGWALSDPLIAILGALTITLLPSTPIPIFSLQFGRQRSSWSDGSNDGKPTAAELAPALLNAAAKSANESAKQPAARRIAVELSTD